MPRLAPTAAKATATGSPRLPGAPSRAWPFKGPPLRRGATRGAGPATKKLTPNCRAMAPSVRSPTWPVEVVSLG